MEVGITSNEFENNRISEERGGKEDKPGTKRELLSRTSEWY